MLNAETEATTREPDMLVARTGPALVKWAKKLLLFGGDQGTEPGIADSEAFSLTDETWESIAPLPEPSACNNAVSFDDMIYIAGKGLPDVIRYNPDTQSYVALGIPLRKNFNGIFVANNVLYVLNKDFMGGSYDMKGRKISTGLEKLPGSGI